MSQDSPSKTRSRKRKSDASLSTPAGVTESDTVAPLAASAADSESVGSKKQKYRSHTSDQQTATDETNGNTHDGVGVVTSSTPSSIPSTSAGRKKKSSAAANIHVSIDATAVPHTPSPPSTPTSVDTFLLKAAADGVMPSSTPTGPLLDSIKDEHITVHVRPERRTPRKEDMDELEYLLSDSPPRQSFPRDCPLSEQLHRSAYRDQVLNGRVSERKESSNGATSPVPRPLVARRVKFATPPPDKVSVGGEYTFTRTIRLANAAVSLSSAVHGVKPPSTFSKIRSRSNQLAAASDPSIQSSSTTSSALPPAGASISSETDSSANQTTTRVSPRRKPSFKQLF